ncbi:MAG TPA: hypothetical protein VF444_06540 [Pseudonocardiaceae bacterium]
MSNVAESARPASSDEGFDEVLDSIADSFARSPRSPVLGSPADHGLEFENVTFPSEDGTPLEGWFVPAAARTVVIVNHPRFFSRSGLPASVEPWRTMFEATGNDIDVDLVPDIALLHAEGYDVLVYDLRNFGLSGAANGGVTSSGNLESRDVIGSLNYVRSRPELRNANIALFSRCLGADATIFGMARAPEVFADVRCLIACQPLSPRMVIERSFERANIPLELIPELDRRIRLRTSFTLDDMSPTVAARAIHIPTLIYQVHDDLMTRPSDVRAIFDAIPDNDPSGRPVPKDLFWIHDTTRRWDGYLHFQREPSRVLEWLARYAA